MRTLTPLVGSLPLKKREGMVPHYVSITITLLFLFILLTSTTTIIATKAAAATSDIAGLSLLFTAETVLSGTTLFHCEEGVFASECKGGLAAVHRRARYLANNRGVAVRIIPQLDAFTVFPSLHPDGVGVNIAYYDRINEVDDASGTNARVIAYFADPLDLSRGGPSYTALKRTAIQPLSSTLDAPVDSDWRFVVKNALIIDLTTMESVSLTSVTTNPKCAILRVNDAGDLWTTSTSVSPLKYGTRLGGDHFVVDEDLEVDDTAAAYSTARTVGRLVSTLRRDVGVVVIMGYDTTIPPTTLLEDMLALEIEDAYLATNATSGGFIDSSLYSHLPDIYVDATGGLTQPYTVAISVTYVTASGMFINKTRDVLFAGINGVATQSLDLMLNLTEVQAAVGLLSSDNVTRVHSVGDTAVSSYSTTIPNWLKNSIYKEDQALLLTWAGEALAHDDVVSFMYEDMQAVWNSTIKNSNCYNAECGKGTLIARALRTQLNTDVSFVSADTPVGVFWEAGDVFLSYLFTAYQTVDSPCWANITGLRLWRLISEKSFEGYAFNSSAGARLMQMSGVKIAYAIQPDGFGKVVSIDVLNRENGEYEPLERLKYYTVGTTYLHCDGWTDLFRKSRLYDGESVQATYSNQLIQFLFGDYMRTVNPYLSLFDDYYTNVSLFNNTNQTYLEYELESSSCTNLQWYDSGLSTCFDCPDGYQQSPYDISSCSEIPIPEPNTTTTITTTTTTAPLLTQPEGINLTLIAAASGGGGALLLIIVLVAVLCEWRRRSGSRANHNAPNGSSDVAVIFTDIKSSTKLWGAAPASMGIALDAHHHLIRSVIGTYRGYEVKTVGDSFMIVVDAPQRAVDLAVSIQNALYDYEWPTAIDDAYSGGFDEGVLDDPEEVCGPEDGVAWNGLRVRIGIHYGPVEVILDAVTKGYDYYGTTVNVAARVEGVTDGGQVCASAAVMAAVASTTDNYTSILLAKTALRGVREDVEVFEIQSTHLPARTFNNPLIFDEGAKVAVLAQDSETQNSSMTTNQTRLSQGVPLTRTTRPIRNIIREAFKAIRGNERVQMLEKLRSAWRVELPSGKTFKGITAAQLVLKEKNAGKDGKRQRKKTKMPVADMASLGVHGGSRNDSAQGTEMTVVSGGGGDYDDTTTNTSSRSNTRTEEDDEEEDEEDIMFRILAQRVEPSVRVLFKKEEGRGTHRESTVRLMDSSTVGGDVFDFYSNEGGFSGGVGSSSASRGTRSQCPPGTSLSNLFDIKSFVGSSAASQRHAVKSEDSRPLVSSLVLGESALMNNDAIETHSFHTTPTNAKGGSSRPRGGGSSILFSNGMDDFQSSTNLPSPGTRTRTAQRVSLANLFDVESSFGGSSYYGSAGQPNYYNGSSSESPTVVSDGALSVAGGGKGMMRNSVGSTILPSAITPRHILLNNNHTSTAHSTNEDNAVIPEGPSLDHLLEMGGFQQQQQQECLTQKNWLT